MTENNLHGGLPELAQTQQFHLRQRVLMMTNRYEIWDVAAGGGEGRLLAVAQQKRLALKEEVRFYTDEGRSQLVFSFKARNVIDLAAGYDVMDAAGRQIGFFRKEFGASLLRSTWRLESGSVVAQGTERNGAIALIRRFIDLPFLFHFDFMDGAGQLCLSSTKKFALRDRYEVQVHPTSAGVIDGRVAAAIAVALDTLQQR